MKRFDNVGFVKTPHRQRLTLRFEVQQACANYKRRTREIKKPAKPWFDGL